MARPSSSRFPSNIISHWYAIAGGVQFSTQDFYESVLAELAARKLPQLRSSRVAYHEGGMLSDKRVYLRLARERYAFDVCAAPFGEEYFFSLRFVQMPRGGWLKLIGLLVVLFFIWMGVILVISNSDFFWWIVLSIVVFLLCRWIVRAGRHGPKAPTLASDSSQKPEMPDFDSFFLGLPVIGGWYERFRKDTYYRYDTRLLYHSIISEIVKTKVDEVTAAKGVKLLRTYDYNPILGELYKAAKTKPGSADVDK